jgi:hypothetical protein
VAAVAIAVIAFQLRLSTTRSGSISPLHFEFGTLEGPQWVKGCKTPSENMFSELLQIAAIVRSAFHYLANPLVLQITAFWVHAIPR